MATTAGARPCSRQAGPRLKPGVRSFLLVFHIGGEGPRIGLSLAAFLENKQGAGSKVEQVGLKPAIKWEGSTEHGGLVH